MPRRPVTLVPRFTHRVLLIELALDEPLDTQPERDAKSYSPFVEYKTFTCSILIFGDWK
jgi:hypothetical protein